MPRPRGASLPCKLNDQRKQVITRNKKPALVLTLAGSSYMADAGGLQLAILPTALRAGYRRANLLPANWSNTELLIRLRQLLSHQ